MLNGVAILTESCRLTAPVAAFKALDMITGDVPVAGARCDGLTQCGGVAGDAVPLVTMGTTTAIAGAAIVAGAELEVGSAGKLVTANLGEVVAVARTAAAADGDEFLVKIK